MSEIEDRVRELCNRHIESQAAYVQIRQIEVAEEIMMRWEDGRCEDMHSLSDELWLMTVLKNSIWDVQVSQSVAGLEADPQKTDALTDNFKSGIELTGYVKTRTQLRGKQPVLYPAPYVGVQSGELKDLSLIVDDLFSFLPKGAGIGFYNMLVRTRHWDSDGSSETRDYLNISLRIDMPESDYPLCLYHRHLEEGPPALSDFDWAEQARSWMKNEGLELYHGADIKDLPWLFSYRALAKLIQGTLGPVFALERPDPFIKGINPASLEDQQITAKGFTMISSLPDLKSTHPLDQEGVPFKEMPLIEDGVLKNFLLTRSSSQALKGNLTLHRNHELSGCSRLSAENYFAKPDLLGAQVLPGEESFGAHRAESHLLVEDIDVFYASADKQTFFIHVNSGIVSKFGGLHRRKAKPVIWHVNREDLWSQLECLGDKTKLVFLPAPSGCHKTEPFAAFDIPEALFVGEKCVTE